MELQTQVKFLNVDKQKRLSYRPFKVLELINNCLKSKTVLDIYVLQDWFMEQIVKPRNKDLSVYMGKDNVGKAVFKYIPEYDVRKKEIKERGGLMHGYHLNEAKAIIKYHIGSLVVNGYLLAIPVIQIDPSEDEEKLLKDI